MNNNLDDAITLATFVLSVVALFINFSRNSWEKQKMKKDLFDDFNKRFDKLNEALNDIRALSMNGQPLTKLYRLPDNSEKDWRGVAQDYLNLCSEEFLWANKKLVDLDVWTSWREGVLFYLEAPCFAELFRVEAKFSKSYYGLFASLQRAGWKMPPDQPD